MLVTGLLDSGPQGSWAESVLSEGAIAGPALLQFEATNVIRRQVARGVVSADLGARSLLDLLRLPVTVVDFEALAPRIWDLRANLTAYDAAYVATAELLRCRLVTLDVRLAKAPGPQCEIVTPPRSS